MSTMTDYGLTKLGTPRLRAPGGGRRPDPAGRVKVAWTISRRTDEQIREWAAREGTSLSGALSDMVQDASTRARKRRGKSA